MPVVGGPQLGKHRQGEHLHAPAEQVLGLDRLVAHLPEMGGARVGALDHHLGGDLGREGHVFVGGRVPPDGVLDEGEQVVGVDALGFGKEARLGQEAVQSLSVALAHRPLTRELQLDRLALDALEQPEVQERHAPVVQQHEVAGMRIAGELAVTVEASHEEAKNDLPDPVALGLGTLLELLEAGPLHELGDQDTLARELAHNLGDRDERVAPEDARQGALVLGLQLVVELLPDPLPDLSRDGLHVETGGHALEQAHDHVQVL